ncbi:UDP-glucose--dolichyl-phosphate glucosyltransferase [Longibacter salinarum]|uniref:UDP-glucose--dolichyl-phosphate glucosyltransferase n=1 Tax=Longibacter salinarum TaxID=1850348 RepID=A0A2A8CYC9_9BACT|nr:glycosyltransferase family 2 protein [Longibacter salinarum]PEN13656.1 UDP-glucose--dolichyl-phosphate glucosyltransferase [Longibacter salinarum]
MSILVIIPAFNEARAIAQVIGDVPDRVDEVVVVNNASTDETEDNARAAGATVLTEPKQGYGYACLRGIEYARARQPDIVVFLDGDYSDHPDEMGRLLKPILNDEADFVVGSRIRGEAEPGAMLPQARIGNRLACTLMQWIWGARYTDLGPFRAIRFRDLLALDMQDQTFGWTIEMQIKAIEAGLRICEVPVSYRKRVGVSKITGTLSGTVKASAKILWTIFRFALRRGKNVPLAARRALSSKTSAAEASG